MTKPLAICPALLAISIMCGCENNAAFSTPEKLDAGLVVILPGIEGESGANRDIRDGLDAAGVDRSLQIWHWGRPLPLLGLVVNQIDFIGNYLAGDRVAQRIMEYQDNYPDRPVHIIGHSGGGGIAVMAAAALPEDRKIDGVVLLSASISSNHDMSKALKRCSNGVVNFYNRDDLVLLGLVTTVLGNVGGAHGPSAGLTGFNVPDMSGNEEKQQAYRKLYQAPLSEAMLQGAGAHFSTTQPHFVSTYVTPWLETGHWPASSDIIEERPEPQPEVEPGTMPEPEPEPEPDKQPKTEPKTKPEIEPKPDPRPKKKPEVNPDTNPIRNPGDIKKPSRGRVCVS